MSNNNCHQEIIRDGSGRLTRYLKALDPTYAPIDSRTFEELLVFIQKYATRIRFYDIPESKIEDGILPEKASWENFFKKDMAVIAASIGVTDTEVIKENYDEIRNELEVSPDADNLAKLFTASITLAAKIDDWYALAIPANPLHNDLNEAIRSILATQLQRIMAYEEGYQLINAQKPLKLDYINLDDNELWGTDQPINADSSVYDGNTPEEKILNAALYADEIFNSFLAVIKNLISKSETYLQFALEQYPAHQPHMALFIAFLQLFQLAQQQMNSLTGRMLDYYYTDVLQLTAKEALPDKVHVVFELAKNVAEYDLARNTLLKAGKDTGGVDQVYATSDDLVINQAKVKEIKTVFIEKDDDLKDKSKGQEVDKIIQNIYANPVANSADGYGKPFEEKADIKWETFGGGLETNISKSYSCGDLQKLHEDDILINYAMPGFAIASPQLVLGGGNRLITLKSGGIDKLVTQLGEPGLYKNPLTIWMTGEKGWIKITKKAKDDDLNGLLKADKFDPPSSMNEPMYGYVGIEGQKKELLLFLPVATEAVIAYDAVLHEGYHYAVSQPVMQVMLNPGFNFSEELFNNIYLGALSIEAKVGSIGSRKKVDGLKSLILQNDQQMLPVGKAINPFTLFPGEGKSFYIGSEEIFNKPINKLSINITNTNESSSDGWEAKLYVLKNREWIELVPYQRGSGQHFSRMSFSEDVFKPLELEKDKTILQDRKPIVELTDWNYRTTKGFIRLDYHATTTGDLSPQELASRLEIKEVALSYSSSLEALEEGIDHFFHVYPFGVVEIGLNDKKQNEGHGDDPSGNGGSSSVEFPSSTAGIDSMLPKIREFHPGMKAIPDSNLVDAGNKLLPQFKFTGIYDSNSGRNKINQYSDKIDQYSDKIDQYPDKIYNIQEEGILFIGLENAKPLQSVSMLFQFAEGSAGDEDNDPPKIHWSYLSHNQWRPLPGENLITDGTYGFQTTGIIKVSIPKEATDNNTIITSGLHWVRASVTENANRIPMLISIVTQAVLATFNDNNNSPEHYDQALAAASINKLKVPVSHVGKVLQPFASFDGKPKEVGKEFYTRVSERLRHKQRAVTAWDYEHLILDRFPSVYKVKCITHTDPNCLCRKKVDENANDNQPDCCGPQIAPGHVLLVPVANLKNRNGVDPLQPKTARRVLIEMVDYIKSLTSPFVKVYAKNPVYEQIFVSFQVEFISGTDVGFHLKKLNDEIVAYLTPWAFDAEAKIVFGQKVYASSIINFIEERPYVDFIADFKMGVCKEDCCPPDDNDHSGNDISAKEMISSLSNCNDVETALSVDADENTGEIVAKPSTPRSILVSVPHHIIKSYEATLISTTCEQRQKLSSNGITPVVAEQVYDLQIVSGIGPAIELLLKNNGINTLQELAETTVEKLKSILQEGELNPQFHNPDTWPTQAASKIGGE